MDSGPPQRETSESFVPPWRRDATSSSSFTFTKVSFVEHTTLEAFLPDLHTHMYAMRGEEERGPESIAVIDSETMGDPSGDELVPGLRALLPQA